MKRAELNGNTLQSMQQVHEQLAAQLALPDYYGCNLDALHDCLTDPCTEPVFIVLRGADALEQTVGAKAKALQRVLRDAAHENGWLTVYIER